MSRISIDVTPEEHRMLKALAALQGKSIKELVLESTLGVSGGGTVEQDLAELERLLQERVRAAERGAISPRRVEDIFAQAREDVGRSPDV